MISVEGSVMGHLTCFLFMAYFSFGIAERSGVFGQTSHTVEPNSTPDQSPVAVNDDSLDGGSMPNRIHDEADDDDPFSKRRYYDSKLRL